MLADALEEAGYRTLTFARATKFEAPLKSITPMFIWLICH